MVNMWQTHFRNLLYTSLTPFLLRNGERVQTQISGEVPAVLKALIEIGCQLRSDFKFFVDICWFFSAPQPEDGKMAQPVGFFTRP